MQLCIHWLTNTVSLFHSFNHSCLGTKDLVSTKFCVNQSSRSWNISFDLLRDRRSQWISKVSRIHPLTVSTTSNDNPSNDSKTATCVFMLTNRHSHKLCMLSLCVYSMYWVWGLDALQTTPASASLFEIVCHARSPIISPLQSFCSTLTASTPCFAHWIEHGLKAANVP